MCVSGNAGGVNGSLRERENVEGDGIFRIRIWGIVFVSFTHFVYCPLSDIFTHCTVHWPRLEKVFSVYLRKVMKLPQSFLLQKWRYRGIRMDLTTTGGHGNTTKGVVWVKDSYSSWLQ